MVSPSADEMRERVPELAARHGIDAGRRLIKQQDARLRNQRAGERELLLHAAAEPPGQTIGEAIHIEHAEILIAALIDLPGRNVTEIADVADVFRDAEIGIEAERLRQIADLRARLARGLAEDFGLARSRLHDAAEYLERGCFAGAIGTDQAENFSLANFKVDGAYCLDGAVVLSQRVNVNRGGIVPFAVIRLSECRRAACAGSSCHLRRAPSGHLSPDVSTWPSAGMPGLAFPKPVFKPSLTPTTCFTRSFWK